jgi:D-3-phosphoglycerate dehydrogenase
MQILLTSTSFQDTPGAHHSLLDKLGAKIIKKRGPLKESTLLKIIHKYIYKYCA